MQHVAVEPSCYRPSLSRCGLGWPCAACGCLCSGARTGGALCAAPAQRGCGLSLAPAPGRRALAQGSPAGCASWTNTAPAWLPARATGTPVRAAWKEWGTRVLCTGPPICRGLSCCSHGNKTLMSGTLNALCPLPLAVQSREMATPLSPRQHTLPAARTVLPRGTWAWVRVDCHSPRGRSRGADLLEPLPRHPGTFGLPRGSAGATGRGQGRPGRTAPQSHRVQRGGGGGEDSTGFRALV